MVVGGGNRDRAKACNLQLRTWQGGSVHVDGNWWAEKDIWRYGRLSGFDWVAKIHGRYDLEKDGGNSERFLRDSRD